MGVRSLGLVALLAVAVALSPLRASATRHAGHLHHDGHGHVHEHFHGDDAHSHWHHHHDDGGDDGGDGDTDDDHHGVIDHVPDSPKLTWTGPRRTGIDALPTLPVPPVAALALSSDWQPMRRAKPPPRSEPVPRHLDLNAIRTVILRL